MVYSTLARFSRVFPPDLSFKSSFARNKSCRFSFPLQLLFWPNFKFQYKFLSFGSSNSGQNHSNVFTVLPPHHWARLSSPHFLSKLPDRFRPQVVHGTAAPLSLSLSLA